MLLRPTINQLYLLSIAPSNRPPHLKQPPSPNLPFSPSESIHQIIIHQATLVVACPVRVSPPFQSGYHPTHFSTKRTPCVCPCPKQGIPNPQPLTLCRCRGHPAASDNTAPQNRATLYATGAATAPQPPIQNAPRFLLRRPALPLPENSPAPPRDKPFAPTISRFQLKVSPSGCQSRPPEAPPRFAE